MEEKVLTATEKAEMVLRLFRGDEAGAVANEAQVLLGELLKWRDVFLKSGTEALEGGGQIGEWWEREVGGLGTAEFAPDCDSLGLDWQLGSEQLERMVMTVCDFMSEQKKLRSV